MIAASVGESAILNGVRGQTPSDVDALVDAILSITRLVTDFPEIVEMDLNPVRVLARDQGCYTLDARMVLGAPGD